MRFARQWHILHCPWKSIQTQLNYEQWKPNDFLSPNLSFPFPPASGFSGFSGPASFPPSTKPLQSLSSAVPSELRLCSPAQSSFPYCFQECFPFPSLHLTPYFSVLLPFPPELVCYLHWEQMAPSSQVPRGQHAQALLLHWPPHWRGLLRKTSLALANALGW